MKCPNGKHDNYCPEEDSVFDPDTEKCVCSGCLLEENKALRRMLKCLVGKARRAHSIRSCIEDDHIAWVELLSVAKEADDLLEPKNG